MDLLLDSLVERLERRGIRVCGCVQKNEESPGRRVCDMLVRAVPSGNVYKISQDLGAGSRGCRLDANALEAAVADVTVAFERGADILIVNKFGKHEGQGRGFRALIGEAVIQDVPVLVGLNDLNYSARSRHSQATWRAMSALAWPRLRLGRLAISAPMRMFDRSDKPTQDTTRSQSRRGIAGQHSASIVGGHLICRGPTRAEIGSRTCTKAYTSF